MKEDFRNASWLHRKYVIEGLTTYEMAELQGCTSTAVRYWMKKYDIERQRTRGGVRKIITRDAITLCRNCHGVIKNKEYSFATKYDAVVRSS
ncbi:MAG: hypothetical protein GF334_03315 [Candidatus Altiarchaeales archaeon]|nr:hypothetical protein [Candidatus Altiarchaeales archaeon]